MDIIDELTRFAKENHPGFHEITEQGLRKFFETYKDTILIWQENGKVRGFAIYQEWPNLLNFIAIAGEGDRTENLRAILRGRKNLPQKPIAFFDEIKMELKILCLRLQQDGQH